MSDQNNFPPIAGAPERAAFMKAFIAIHNAMRDSFLSNYPDLMNDADVPMLMLIATAVIQGHSEGRPMTAHTLAKYLHLDRMTVKRKLDKLVRLGPFVLQGEYYFLNAERSGPFPPKLEADFARTFYELVKAMVPFLHRYPNYGVTVGVNAQCSAK